MPWLDISDLVYSKFGRTCKNIEFLYLTNLLSSLIPLVLEVYAHRGDNAFRQYFVNSIKYPYSPKQLHTLYQKCATILLNTFKKIYRGRYLYSSIISSSDNINTYNLPSLDNGKVLACGHGYHDYCLEKCNLKCLICLDYLRGEVSKNINALRVSMRKKLGENEFIEEDFGGVVEDDLDNSETAIDDAATIENLENAKKSFFEL
ncbi:hypothetical protein C2G38_2223625 [Gigaspora rosea]|uniref:Uncharacterized protein n=1 Tax=Gigaspora rosea TaxID=44941 RepID=A0A397U9I6_9GLOM|nr:hypothetical protein C2G38_2223625 [Gigaspora rosea]